MRKGLRLPRRERVYAMSKRGLVIGAVLWLALFVAGITVISTLRISGADVQWTPLLQKREGVFVSQEEYDTLLRYARLEEVRQILETQYYTEVDEDVLLTGAVRGMMDALGDPYTFYYTPVEMQEMVDNASGEFQGIGVTTVLDPEGTISIVRVYRDSPAYRAGVLAGDILIRINDTSVTDATVQDYEKALQEIASFGDAPMTLTFLRSGEEVSFTLRREHFIIDRIEESLLSDSIGYVQISDFLGNDVEGFRRALTYFSREKITGLIIDLRNNTGGYLDDVVDIADMLLPEGLIVYTEDRAGHREEELSDAECVSYPIVCLVNGVSASASEVLAGALQDHGAALIVGDTTFGKGIVQTVWSFDDGAGMQLTTATYYTPSGRCIHGTGITPDDLVEDDPETSVDEVLQFAQKWLVEGGIDAQG